MKNTEYSDENLCSAHGCPNRWSIDAGDGRFCGWHYRQPPHLWPRISEQQRDAETDRITSQQQRDEPPVQLSIDGRREVFAKLAAMRAELRASPRDPKAWIAALQARKDAGERLSLAQLWCLQQAALYAAKPAAEDVDADIQLRREDERARQAQTVREYAEAHGVRL